MSEAAGDYRVEVGRTPQTRELPSFAFFSRLPHSRSGKWHGRFPWHGGHMTCDALVYSGPGFPVRGEMDLSKEGGHERWRIEQTSRGINFKLAEESDYTMLSSHVAPPVQQCHGTEIRLIFKRPLASVRSPIMIDEVDIVKSEAQGLQSGTIKDVLKDLSEKARAMEKAS